MNNRRIILDAIFFTGLILNLCGLYGFGIANKEFLIKLDIQRIGVLLIILSGVLNFCYGVRINIRIACLYLSIFSLFLISILVHYWQGKFGIEYSLLEACLYAIVPICFFLSYKECNKRILNVILLSAIITISLVSYLELFFKSLLFNFNYRNLLNNDSQGVSKYGGRIYIYAGGGGLDSTPNSLAHTLILISLLIKPLYEFSRKFIPYVLALYFIAIIQTENRTGLIFVIMYLIILISIKYIRCSELLLILITTSILAIIPLKFSNSLGGKFEFNGNAASGNYFTNNCHYCDFFQSKSSLYPSRFDGGIINIVNIFKNYHFGYGPLSTDKFGEINSGFIEYNDPGLNLILLFEYGIPFIVIIIIAAFLIGKSINNKDYRYYCFTILSIGFLFTVLQIRNAHTWVYFTSLGFMLENIKTYRGSNV